MPPDKIANSGKHTHKPVYKLKRTITLFWLFSKFFKNLELKLVRKMIQFMCHISNTNINVPQNKKRNSS